MKIFPIILFLFLFSCSKSSNDDIEIYPLINKKDSLLILKIRNNTGSNLMIEFPTLDNFLYKDELESSTSEVLYVQKSFEILENKDDLSIYTNKNCSTVMELMNSTSILTPKFIKKNSEKEYYLKIKRYRGGKTIVFNDDGFDKLNISDNNKRRALQKIKDQNCFGYRYFTGNFSFYPNEIILE